MMFYFCSDEVICCSYLWREFGGYPININIRYSKDFKSYKIALFFGLIGVIFLVFVVDKSDEENIKLLTL